MLTMIQLNVLPEGVNFGCKLLELYFTCIHHNEQWFCNCFLVACFV